MIRYTVEETKTETPDSPPTKPVPEQPPYWMSGNYPRSWCNCHGCYNARKAGMPTVPNRDGSTASPGQKVFMAMIGVPITIAFWVVVFLVIRNLVVG